MPTVQTGDIETYYETRGEGPPLLFVHGALSDHSAAAAQLDAFSEECTTIAYDLRGHGQTANPRDAPYSIDLLAADLDAFITALDLDHPVLCGVSMGGMVAQTYASRHPDGLGGLVLADTFTPSFVDRRDRFERTVLTRASLELLRLVGYERAMGALTWLGRRIERNRTTSLRPERFPPMETAAAVNALRAVLSFQHTDIDLRSITVPTLILYGEHETSVIRRHVPTLAAEIPRATVREVPDAGHASPWDNPAFFNDAIRTFLTEIVSSPAAGSEPPE
ncbi:alpha/beta fold hydrolase [Salinirubrum litoreum]|uniref:Alpha/beta fold hydrolase n=1 Tax=Salinirubrum litoreum TaxID=1126234 RepID=A0ABD5RGV8_9EURY|nr:alpha/beta hydrolase [Salinirubrum litoreum]